MDKKYFKAFIRAVKTIDVETRGDDLEHFNIIREPLIKAADKKEVKLILLNKYPQLFQKNKVYEKGTKDKAQFFYVVIFELYEYEKQLIKDGEWICDSCGQKYTNKYEYRPYSYSRIFKKDKLFCNSECSKKYENENFNTLKQFEGEEHYINKNSINYIYKITEKTTNKCYIGKTKNAPFFRWWNHLTKSHSPFGLYLQQTKLSDWIFEVIKELPCDTSDNEILRIESEYILKYNSIENGYNSLISNKEVKS